MALPSRTNLITFDMMAGRLLQESARRHIGQVSNKGHENNTNPGSQTAFASSTIRGQSGTKCHYCGKEGHWKKDCYKRKADEGGTRNSGGWREFTFRAENTGPAPSMGWIINSGAGQHLCGNRNTFSTYTNISKVQEITIADGTKIKAEGVGTIEIVSQESSITLKDVWHVPDIGGNRLSVSRMVDAGYTVQFGQSTCNIRKAGVRALLGRRIRSLY